VFLVVVSLVFEAWYDGGEFGGFYEWYGGNVCLWILRECKFSRFLVSSSSRPGINPGLSFFGCYF
jgi:hypothetical protein